MKSALSLVSALVLVRRSPCGERGLKFLAVPIPSIGSMSLPVRGAWIEIGAGQPYGGMFWSLPVRGAWIEI